LVLAFYLDEQVPELLAVILRSLGYDVVSANQLGNKGLHDGRQLLIAARAGRVMVTYNVKDFTLLHRSWLDWSVAWRVEDAARHAGVLLIHASKGLTSRVIADAMVEVDESGDDLTNRLMGWHAARGWHEIG
jgi:hypothetical protein